MAARPPLRIAPAVRARPSVTLLVDPSAGSASSSGLYEGARLIKPDPVLVYTENHYTENHYTDTNRRS